MMCFMEENEKRGQLRLDLDRVNFWISNVDQKAGIILAILGVVVSMVGSTDKVIDIIEVAIKPLKKSILTDVPLPFSNIIYAFLMLCCIVLLSISIYFFITTITAKINPKVFKEKGLNVESLLHFQSINKRTFTNFKRLREEQLVDYGEESRDYLSQIYINSDICTAKFQNYNKGICFLKWFLLCFVITSVILLYNHTVYD